MARRRGMPAAKMNFGTCLDPDLAGVGFCFQSWACGADGRALPWHGRGRRLIPTGRTKSPF